MSKDTVKIILHQLRTILIETLIVFTAVSGITLLWLSDSKIVNTPIMRYIQIFGGVSLIIDIQLTWIESKLSTAKDEDIEKVQN